MTKILVVDDEEMMIKVTEKILSERYEVLTASSGEEALEIYDREKPALVLSDLLMPGMNGFEMHEALQKKYGGKIPIMYMTADDADDLEGKGFDMGAMDFIRKPFRADVLMRRVGNILMNLEQIKDLKEEASTDKLTGFLNKAAVTDKLREVVKTERGVLMMIDLDSFKLVNDIYGHEKGDAVLVAFSNVIRSNMRSDDILGRAGGDEFIAFGINIIDEETVARISARINTQLYREAKKLLGDDFTIPLGVSIGGVFVPEEGTDYDELFPKADKALYFVKQNGKHGYSMFGNPEDADFDARRDSKYEMDQLSKILEERNTSNCAFWLGQDAFSYVYRFMLRHINSYHGVAYKVLFTIVPIDSNTDAATFSVLTKQFGDALNSCLRKSDIMMQSKQNQYFLLLPEINEQHINVVIERILKKWSRYELSSLAKVKYVSELIESDDNNGEEKRHR
ncbi:MAG: diguanylate cyclase [Clostridiales bacterium]|nr:diguanylate cyclase [Clostridiales bacterium]